MEIGFLVPNYPNEKRVALLPEHICNFDNEIVIENGFGNTLDIADEKYLQKGCNVNTRENILKNIDVIFSLKLIQPSDYSQLREGQMIIGWTHPKGSGARFYQKIAKTKKLIIVDLDNIYPSIYYGDKQKLIPWLPKNFVWKNSFNAGYSSVMHGLVSYGLIPATHTKVAVLATGSVSQGANNAISKFNCDIRMFYRKTMHEFKDTIGEYDIIINGIEMDNPDEHIITKEELKQVKKGCFILDSAADAGNAIEGTHYTSIDNPIYFEDGIYFYEVNSSPSIFYRKSSYDISESFSKWIYKEDIKKYYSLI